MRVGKNIRARMKSEGDPREAEDIIIILACTELPAAIGRKMGFIKNGMINPGYLAVEIAQKRIQEASQKTPTTPTTPSSTSPAERKKAVNLFRAATEQLREKERVTGSDSDDSDLGTPQGHTGTIDEKQGKEIAGFKVFVFIDSKGDYRITARGGEDSERAVWLTKVLDEIYEGIKARNPEDRLNRKKDYIVFHNPNPEGEFPEGTLLKQLKGWLRKNELEGEKIQQSASPTTETKTGKSMVASQSIVATPAATVTLTAFSRIEPPQRTRTV
jgi:hypothetical protein